jgi:hypothetical protein
MQQLPSSHTAMGMGVRACASPSVPRRVKLSIAASSLDSSLDSSTRPGECSVAGLWQPLGVHDTALARAAPNSGPSVCGACSSLAPRLPLPPCLPRRGPPPPPLPPTRCRPHAC